MYGVHAYHGYACDASDSGDTVACSNTLLNSELLNSHVYCLCHLAYSMPRQN